MLAQWHGMQLGNFARFISFPALPATTLYEVKKSLQSQIEYFLNSISSQPTSSLFRFEFLPPAGSSSSGWELSAFFSLARLPVVCLAHTMIKLLGESGLVCQSKRRDKKEEGEIPFQKTPHVHFFSSLSLHLSLFSLCVLLLLPPRLCRFVLILTDLFVRPFVLSLFRFTFIFFLLLLSLLFQQKQQQLAVYSWKEQQQLFECMY